MNTVFPYLLLSFLMAQNNEGFGPYMLGIIFFISIIGGYKLIRLRTGNYDVDYFTKLLGWAITIFGIVGLFQCYEYLN